MLVRTKANYKWYALSCTTLGALLSVAGAVIGPILGGFLNGLHRAFWLSFMGGDLILLKGDKSGLWILKR